MEAQLPPLREDLRLVEGGADENGHPTWTMIDLARHRFFRIGWVEQAMLARWGATTEAVVDSVNTETTLRINKDRVQEVAGFLVTNELCSVTDGKHLHAAAKRRKQHPLEWLLHNYLFIRIPILHPDAFLNRTLRWVRPFFTQGILLWLLSLALVALYLVGRQWDSFVSTFLHFFTLEGAFYYALALAATKSLHELGHAYAAKYKGLRVPSMGIAFLVMMPVLYTDTGEAWKLKRRRDRLLIAAAGIGVETGLAIIATFAWSFLPDGVARSIAFFTATTSWTMSLLVNISPFMRFDGYYLLADFLGVANMQERAFALARWRMRKFLWGIEAPCPEAFSPAKSHFLIAYAYATWIYRFTLFLGIALFVYYQFFKLLGIFLMAVEVGWFILRPIYAEMKAWWKSRSQIIDRRRAALTLLGLCGCLALLVFPWKTGVEAPALVKPEKSVELYFPVSGRLAAMDIGEGRAVAEGATLIELQRFDLTQETTKLSLKLESIGHEIAQAHTRPDQSARLPVLFEQQGNIIAQKAEIADQINQMTVRASFSGIVRDVEPALAVGDWVGKGKRFARLLDPKGMRVEAFVEETELGRLQIGAKARFQPEAEGHPILALKVIEIEHAGLAKLQDVILASTHGGPIAASMPPNGDRPAPLGAVHRVVMVPENSKISAPAHIIRGTAIIEGERRSLFSRAWRHAASVLLRESGF
jgi:putative peptide zinc metalloprotease protein